MHCAFAGDRHLPFLFADQVAACLSLESRSHSAVSGAVLPAASRKPGSAKARWRALCSKMSMLWHPSSDICLRAAAARCVDTRLPTTQRSTPMSVDLAPKQKAGGYLGTVKPRICRKRYRALPKAVRISQKTFLQEALCCRPGKAPLSWRPLCEASCFGPSWLLQSSSHLPCEPKHRTSVTTTPARSLRGPAPVSGCGMRRKSSWKYRKGTEGRII